MVFWNNQLGSVFPVSGTWHVAEAVLLSRVSEAESVRRASDRGQCVLEMWVLQMWECCWALLPVAVRMQGEGSEDGRRW